MSSQLVGLRYLKSKGELSHVLRYSFDPYSSIGRVSSQIVKDILKREKEDPSKRVYLIDSPDSLTFSASREYLISKYKNKYDCGGKSKGPFYVKSVVGLFKLILRTMMKYKGKHKKVYKKICVMRESDKDSKISTVKISVRSSNKLSRSMTLSQLMEKL